MTNNTTHSTAIMGVTDYHNKMDTLGKGKHTYKDLTWPDTWARLFKAQLS